MPCLTVEDKKPTSSFAEERAAFANHWLSRLERVNRTFDGTSSILKVPCTSAVYMDCYKYTANVISEAALMEVRLPSVDPSKHHLMPNVRVLKAGVTWAKDAEIGKFDIPFFLHGELEQKIDDFVADGYAKAGGNEWTVKDLLPEGQLGTAIDNVLGLVGYDTKGKQKHMYIVLGWK